jgi:magnesium-transporting ATPase (P-type)
VPAEKLMTQLGSGARGLAKRKAAERLKLYGPNALKAMKRSTALGLFANQFKSPLVLILIVASIISLIAAEWIEAPGEQYRICRWGDDQGFTGSRIVNTVPFSVLDRTSRVPW